MELPKAERAREMSIEELDKAINTFVENNKNISVKKQKNLAELYIIRNQRIDADKPAVFNSGAKVIIQYVSGNEEITPTTRVSGLVLRGNNDEIVAESTHTQETYVIDLTDHTVEVKQIETSEGDTKETIIEDADLYEIKLTHHPQMKESDRSTNVLTPSVIQKKYDFIREGFFIYPCPDFFKPEFNQNVGNRKETNC